MCSLISLLLLQAVPMTFYSAMRSLTLILIYHLLTQAHETYAELKDQTLSTKCISAPLGPLDPIVRDATCPLLVDDDTSFERHSWHPWTFPPACIRAGNHNHSKLCTFTSTNFRGDSAVSIITTPEIASAGSHVLGDLDPQWADWEKGYAHPVYLSPPYEIKEIRDKGLGIVSNRSIHKGEIIMTRYPIILRMIDIAPWRYQDILNLLHRAGIQLPTKEKAAMLALAHSKGGYIVDDIMNTNSFGVLLDGVDHQGLYLDVSRINHACKPNLFNRVSSTLAMEVVAYRDIDEGEELTISYTPLNLLSEQRQSLIRDWGFNCTCSLCASHNDSKISDRRRRTIQRLLEELDNPKFQSHSAIRERVAKILDLCEEEGLTAQIGDFYAIIGNVFNSMGDISSAKEYSELAVKELRYYAGYDHERTRTALAFLGNLSTGSNT